MIRIAMKPILILLALASVVVVLQAEEAKTSPQRSADEISKEIEALQMKIKALDEEKKAVLRETPDAKGATRSSEQKVGGNVKTAIAKGRKVLITEPSVKGTPQSGGQNRNFIITPANVVVIPNDVELHNVNYMTPRMSMEMAERHSAEKIKAQVNEAAARAKRILEGHPPSLVHGN